MYGLVLEGGGAKGSYQVGAVKALKKLQIEYDCVVGSSIGSINGALVAIDDIKALEKVWLSTDATSIFGSDGETIKNLMKLDMKGDVHEYARFISNALKSKGIDTTKIKAYMKKYVDEEKLRESDIDFGLVTLSLMDMMPLEIFKDDIPKGELHEYIMASANFPAFKIDKYNEKLYVDGGMYDNLPINTIIDRGYKDIIAIRIFGIGRFRKVKEVPGLNIIYIEPKEDLGKILEVDKKRAKYNIALGYYDTLKKFRNYSGKRYYIDIDVDQNRLVNEFMAISDDSVIRASHMLGVSVESPVRGLFEKVLPRLGELIKSHSSSNYQELLIDILEYVAMEEKIERFRIYKLSEFMNLVLDKLKEQEKKYDEMLEQNSMFAIQSVATFQNLSSRLRERTVLSVIYTLSKDLDIR